MVPSVLYSFEDFLVLNKPAYWVCEMESNEKNPTNSTANNSRSKHSGDYNKKIPTWLQQNNNSKPGGLGIDESLFSVDLNPAISGATGFGPLLHRLDQQTSGILLCAKNKTGYDRIKKQFHRKQVIKRYICLVHGKVDIKVNIPSGNSSISTTSFGNTSVSNPIGIIELPIRTVRSSTSTFSEVVQGGSKEALRDAEPATTYYQVLRYYYTDDSKGNKSNVGNRIDDPNRGEGKNCNVYSLLACEIPTGRTHQIRVHMQSLGHAIVGDEKYKMKDEKKHSKHNKGASSSTSSINNGDENCRPKASISSSPIPAISPRLFLHSYMLKLKDQDQGDDHKKDSDSLHFICPLPKTLKKVLKSLSGEPLVQPENGARKVSDHMISFPDVHISFPSDPSIQTSLNYELSNPVSEYWLRSKLAKSIIEAKEGKLKLPDAEKHGILFTREMIESWWEDFSITQTADGTLREEFVTLIRTKEEAQSNWKKRKEKERRKDIIKAKDDPVKNDDKLESDDELEEELQDLRQKKLNAVKSEDFETAATLKALEDNLLSERANQLGCVVTGNSNVNSAPSILDWQFRFSNLLISSEKETSSRGLSRGSSAPLQSNEGVVLGFTKGTLMTGKAKEVSSGVVTIVEKYPMGHDLNFKREDSTHTREEDDDENFPSLISAAITGKSKKTVQKTTTQKSAWGQSDRIDQKPGKISWADLSLKEYGDLSSSQEVLPDGSTSEFPPLGSDFPSLGSTAKAQSSNKGIKTVGFQSKKSPWGVQPSNPKGGLLGFSNNTKSDGKTEEKLQSTKTESQSQTEEKLQSTKTESQPQMAKTENEKCDMQFVCMANAGDEFATKSGAGHTQCPTNKPTTESTASAAESTTKTSATDNAPKNTTGAKANTDTTVDVSKLKSNTDTTVDVSKLKSNTDTTVDVSKLKSNTDTTVDVSKLKANNTTVSKFQITPKRTKDPLPPEEKVRLVIQGDLRNHFCYKEGGVVQRDFRTETRKVREQRENDISYRFRDNRISSEFSESKATDVRVSKASNDSKETHQSKSSSEGDEKKGLKEQKIGSDEGDKKSSSHEIGENNSSFQNGENNSSFQNGENNSSFQNGENTLTIGEKKLPIQDLIISRMKAKGVWSMGSDVLLDLVPEFGRKFKSTQPRQTTKLLRLFVKQQSSYFSASQSGGSKNESDVFIITRRR